MRKFDTKVQHLKYKVLREVAREAWNGTLTQNLLDIPKTIVPGNEPTMRCCVYKERAILGERVKIAMGGDKENPNVIEVIEIACDECPMGGYEVTEACRGCLAHRCEDVCRRGAITFDSQQKAHIDKTKCVECGQCAKVCPYSAIMDFKRPCVKSCKVGAISMTETKAACIDNNKCISCGACVYQCPFGAITDKSFILDAIEMLKNKEKVYAVIAPSISSQFRYAKLGQVITGIKALGFHSVVEAALGADMVAYAESGELAEKGYIVISGRVSRRYLEEQIYGYESVNRQGDKKQWLFTNTKTECGMSLQDIPAGKRSRSQSKERLSISSISRTPKTTSSSTLGK